MTTVLTLSIDPASQHHFEALRREHYPPELNRIPAHVSLFHQLPGTKEIEGALREVCADLSAFPVQVQGLRSLGRGVAFTLASPELMSLHRELVRRFEPYLIPQDRQRFQPHIVVQNKVAPERARELLARLQASFVSSEVQGTGLTWWEYLGGPWRLMDTFSFSQPQLSP